MNDIHYNEDKNKETVKSLDTRTECVQTFYWYFIFQFLYRTFQLPDLLCVHVFVQLKV